MSDQQRDGRPEERDEGRPDQVPPVGEGTDADPGKTRAGKHHETVALEERGGTPTTEHAPGGDL